MSTNIEWTNETWNPLTGCTLVSEGCRNCYAAREAAGRLSHHPAYAGLAVRRGGRPVFTGEVRLHEDRLEQPLRWKRPRMIFVNSMSDLFHESVPDEFIEKVFSIMAMASHHIFQVLTKRPERMAEFMQQYIPSVTVWADRLRAGGIAERVAREYAWPLPNVWLGTSVEDQTSADRRIPALLETPAAVRFLSCEPLLWKVDLEEIRLPDGRHCLPLTGIEWPEPRIHWVIVGGESGPKARPMHPDWARSLRDQCQAAGVAFFFKQWGEWLPLLGHREHLNLPPEDRTWQRIGGVTMVRVGKKAAGRLLDGRTWDEMPAVAGTLVQEEA
jgi:protein gp37